MIPFYLIRWCRKEYWTYVKFVKSYVLVPSVSKVDMLTARRRLNSPRSPWSTSGNAHPTLVNIMAMNRWLTYSSFHVSRPSHSLYKAISNSDLETPRLRSWVWWRGTVIPSILLIRFIFISHQPDQQFLRYSYFTIFAASQVKVKCQVKSQGHMLYPICNRGTSFTFHINRSKHSWDIAKIVSNRSHRWISMSSICTLVYWSAHEHTAAFATSKQISLSDTTGKRHWVQICVTCEIFGTISFWIESTNRVYSGV